jgi:hypothetical protein
METKQNVYIYFGIVINLVHTILFAVINVLKVCRITLPLGARGITLGMSENNIENQNSVNHI